MYDNVNDEYNVPLLKQPRQKKSSQNIEAVKEPVKLDKKPRPPKTEKQMEQFKKVIAARKQKVEENKLKKKIEASKFLLEQGIIKEEKRSHLSENHFTEKETFSEKQEVKTELKKPAKQQAPSKEWDLENQSDSDSSSEEQIVVVKKKKKAKKKIIVMQSETDSDSESSDEKPVVHRKFKTQQNKKSVAGMPLQAPAAYAEASASRVSVVKIHKEPITNIPNKTYKNYFV